MPSPDIALVLGTRPEIVKLAGVYRLLGPSGRLVWTGQHWDPALTSSFSSHYGLGRLHQSLGSIGGRSRGEQIGRMTAALSDHFSRRKPAAVVVQGDTNSALSGALAAHCVGIPVVHVEAGLRSFDAAMPEEANRRLIAPITDLHCAPTLTAAEHLVREGIEEHRITVTGNTVVEATLESLPAEPEATRIVADHGVRPDGYVLATIHRPENTDDPQRLAALLDQLAALHLPVLLPLHPRTKQAVMTHDLHRHLDRLTTLGPLDHATFLALARHSRLLVSDSGGVQEECTVLKRPLVVVRNSTERPEAITAGFARLARPGPELAHALHAALADEELCARLEHTPSPYGTGQAGASIVTELRTRYLTGAPAPTPLTPVGDTRLHELPLLPSVLLRGPAHHTAALGAQP